ncbi:MAG: site-specific integrase [Owenweeksia sp.]
MVTAKLVLWTYHKPAKNGYPLKVLVTKERKTKPYNMKLYSHLEDWNMEAMEPKKSHPRYLFIRKHIRKIKGRIEDLLDEAYEKDLTKEEFISKLGGQKVEKRKKIITFFKFTEQRIKELRDDGKYGSAKAHEAYTNALKLYNNNQDLSFQQVDYNFLNEFKSYKLRNGMSNNSLRVYFTCYAMIYKEAIRRKIISSEHYPFVKGLRPSATRTAKRNISKKDILKLENATGLQGSRLEARNYYLMMFYLGGMDLVDISNLTIDNISNGRIKYNRTKLESGGLEIDLKIFKKAQEIIDFYHIGSSKSLFPITSSRDDYDGYTKDYGKVNYNLKALGKELGIELKLTSKTARHTFSTIGKRLYIDREMLKELMGHEGNEVADVYKDRFPQKDRDRDHWKIIKT